MSTCPRLPFRPAAEDPAGVALQEKRYGVWQPLTWADYAAVLWSAPG
jgi:long-chain acyl-CoA synthetase